MLSRSSVDHSARQILSILLSLVLLTLAACNDDVEESAKEPSSQSIPDTTGLPSFSGENAYHLIEQQIPFGTREPGSPGAAKARDFYLQEFAKYSTDVRPQKFTHTGDDGELTMTNIIASFNPSATSRILLAAHWDSRPWADQESDSARHSEPILAVNDGLSGVSVLLELARIMKENPPPIGVDIVLFDGEDYGREGTGGRYDNYFLGSTFFAEKKEEGYRPIFGILLDMVGDSKATFYREKYSDSLAPYATDLVWRAARNLGLSRFDGRVNGAVLDDHIPLNEIAGIPTTDIIDAELVGYRRLHRDPATYDPDRAYWHTHDDQISHISSETLRQVGSLLTYLIYSVVPEEIARAQK